MNNYVNSFAIRKECVFDLLKARIGEYDSSKTLEGLKNYLTNGLNSEVRVVGNQLETEFQNIPFRAYIRRFDGYGSYRGAGHIIGEVETSNQEITQKVKKILRDFNPSP